MTSAANDQAYGGSNWGPGANAQGGPWRQRYWDMLPPWMPFYAVKPLVTVAMVLGFIFWWPIGLVLLGVLIWSKRMMWCHSYRRHGGWPGHNGSWQGWKSWSADCGASPSSGNYAFDEYRAETLRRLEDEQKEFAEFLDRLRVAKDKAEFDQFMNDRRKRPETPPEQPQPA